MRLLFVCIYCLLSVGAEAQPFIQILGVVQDGGYPHIGCKKQCCTAAWGNDATTRHVVSFAMVDPTTKQWWLFEATPDIKEQLQYFYELTSGAYNYLPDGIFLTHAHMGHYTGLMQLGREALGAKAVKVYAMPTMKSFLEKNGPWSQLVKLKNIDIQKLNANSIAGLTRDVKVQPVVVPHRDEFSETVGFKIITSEKKYLFIPDIDKWSKWNKNIVEEVKKVDIALLDATFYNSEELPGRRMDEVPHPFVQETMQLFSNEDVATKSKIHFIHMNHTNPMLWDANIKAALHHAGYRIAIQGIQL